MVQRGRRASRPLTSFKGLNGLPRCRQTGYLTTLLRLPIFTRGYFGEGIAYKTRKKTGRTHKPHSVPRARWESSLWDARCRTPHAAYPTLSAGRAAPLRLLDLAPGGVCLAAIVTNRAGALLPHPFTLTPLARCGLLSVALCRRIAPPGR